MKLVNIYLVMLFLISLSPSVYAQNKSSDEQTLYKSLKPIYKSNSEIVDDSLSQTLSKFSLIGLGESSHGTKDIFDLKTNIILRLVQIGVVKTVFLETDYCGLETLNEHLHNDSDTATNQAFKSSGIYAVYRTQEVYRLIRNLKEYNKHHPKEQQVSIKGIDMWYTKYILTRIREKYADLESNNMDIHTGLTELASLVNEKQKKKVSEVYKEEFDALIQHLYSIAQNSSDAQLKWYTRLLEQSITLYETGNTNDYETLRDKYMADNIISMMSEQPERNHSIIWAHNGHIAMQSLHKVVRMGYYLREKFKEQYFPVAIDFNEGNVRVYDSDPLHPGYKEFTYQPSENKKAIEYLLKNAPVNDFFFNVDIALQKQPLRDILKHYTEMRIIGAIHLKNENQDYYNIPLIENFKGLLFLKHTTASICYQSKQ